MNNAIQTALQKKGHKIFLRPFELNIVGVRSDSVTPNAFDDHINVFFNNAEGKLVNTTFLQRQIPAHTGLKIQ
jgi:hypothetical protein